MPSMTLKCSSGYPMSSTELNR